MCDSSSYCYCCCHTKSTGVLSASVMVYFTVEYEEQIFYLTNILRSTQFTFLTVMILRIDEFLGAEMPVPVVSQSSMKWCHEESYGVAQKPSPVLADLWKQLHILTSTYTIATTVVPLENGTLGDFLIRVKLDIISWSSPVMISIVQISEDCVALLFRAKKPFKNKFSTFFVI